jgi:hypothetical protein
MLTIEGGIALILCDQTVPKSICRIAKLSDPDLCPFERFGGELENRKAQKIVRRANQFIAQLAWNRLSK